GRWNLQDVDVLAEQHVLENRRLGDLDWLDRLDLLEAAAPGIDQRGLAPLRRQAQRVGDALDGPQRTGEHTGPRLVAVNLVEEHRGRRVVLGEHFLGESDLLLGVGAVHTAKLAETFDTLDPFAEITVPGTQLGIRQARRYLDHTILLVQSVEPTRAPSCP